MRIVVDTNMLVAAAYNPASASRRIVEAVRQEQLRLIVSPAILREYEAVLSRAVRCDTARAELLQTIELAESVTPEEVPRVTEDRSDDKFLAAAAAGQADAVVSSDRHLLAVHPYEGIEILRPTAFWSRLGDGM